MTTTAVCEKLSGIILRSCPSRPGHDCWVFWKSEPDPAPLWNDPGTGVLRHVDAGYPEAVACEKERGLGCR